MPLPNLLRSEESCGFEMLIVPNVFQATFRKHHFKRHAIREAETAFLSLPRPRCAELVEPLIDPHNPTPHDQFSQKILHRIPAQPRLDQRPTFVQDITRCHQSPLAGFGI